MSDNPYDRPERLEFALSQREIYKEEPSIHQTVLIPVWVTIGKRVTIHKGVMFTTGFGYARLPDGNWIHIPHTGKVIIGDDVDIHPYTTINRATVDTTTIGKGTKIDHHCHIGHNSHIGENCIITANVTLCGSVVIGDNVWIGVGSTIRNKIKVPNNTYIGNMSNVVNDFREEGMLIYGNPAKGLEAKFLPHNKIG